MGLALPSESWPLASAAASAAAALAAARAASCFSTAWRARRRCSSFLNCSGWGEGGEVQEGEAVLGGCKTAPASRLA